jgi:hypothetical protein
MVASLRATGGGASHLGTSKVRSEIGWRHTAKVKLLCRQRTIQKNWYQEKLRIGVV